MYSPHDPDTSVWSCGPSKIPTLKIPTLQYYELLPFLEITISGVFKDIYFGPSDYYFHICKPQRLRVQTNSNRLSCHRLLDVICKQKQIPQHGYHSFHQALAFVYVSDHEEFCQGWSCHRHNNCCDYELFGCSNAQNNWLVSLSN